jgi:hypothetical protein
MKKLIYIILFIVLVSCSTSKKAKPCRSCPHFSYIVNDTIILKIPHHNYNGTCFPGYETLLVIEEEILVEKY